MHVGCDPDQLPSERQVRVDDPTSLYLLLQVQVALPPASRVVTETRPYLGELRQLHLPAQQKMHRATVCINPRDTHQCMLVLFHSIHQILGNIGMKIQKVDIHSYSCTVPFLYQSQRLFHALESSDSCMFLYIISCNEKIDLIHSMTH